MDHLSQVWRDNCNPGNKMAWTDEQTKVHILRSGNGVTWKHVYNWKIHIFSIVLDCNRFLFNWMETWLYVRIHFPAHHLTISLYAFNLRAELQIFKTIIFCLNGNLKFCTEDPFKSLGLALVGLMRTYFGIWIKARVVSFKIPETIIFCSNGNMKFYTEGATLKLSWVSLGWTD